MSNKIRPFRGGFFYALPDILSIHLGNLMTRYHRISMMIEALSGTFGVWYVVADQGSGAEKMYFQNSRVARMWIENHPEATVIEGPSHEVTSELPPSFTPPAGRRPILPKQKALSARLA